MPAGENAGLGGGAQGGGLWMGSLTHFQIPPPLAEGLYLWAEGDFRGQKWGTPCHHHHPPTRGSEKGRKYTPHDGLGA